RSAGTNHWIRATRTTPIPALWNGSCDAGRKGCRLDPAHQKQDHEDDQDDTDNPDAAVTIAVAVAAEAATESTEQCNDEDDDENQSERHGAALSAIYSPCRPL